MFDRQRNAHMNEVLQAAKAEREQLLDAARQESEDLRARLQLALNNEQHSLDEDISRRAREELFAIARKIAWSITDYLGSLAKNVDDLLKDKSETGGAAPEYSTQKNSATTEVQDVDINEH